MDNEKILTDLVDMYDSTDRGTLLVGGEGHNKGYPRLVVDKFFPPVLLKGDTDSISRQSLRRQDQRRMLYSFMQEVDGHYDNWDSQKAGRGNFLKKFSLGGAVVGLAEVIVFPMVYSDADPTYGYIGMFFGALGAAFGAWSENEGRKERKQSLPKRRSDLSDKINGSIAKYERALNTLK